VRVFITGGAGFIGSHMARRLVDDGHDVTVYDNLSLGRRDFLADLPDTGRCTFIEADLLDRDRLGVAIAGHDLVMHLAANSDIPHGVADPEVDLRQGALATFHVLEAMRAHGIGRLVFASSSVVYGEAETIPTPEDYGPLLPISFYGASKLAGEGLVAAYNHNAGIQSWIYRFGNIVGPNATHGVVLDFVRKLQADPTRLEVLGDGRQAKPYLYVTDCVDGMLFGLARARDPVNVFNLAVGDVLDVASIARIVIGAMGLADVAIAYTGGARGWPGDVPRVGLDPSRMADLGWTASMASRRAVERAAAEVVAQECRG